MRFVAILCFATLVLVGCRSGSVDTVAVENPEVEVTVAPRATATASPAPVTEAASTPAPTVDPEPTAPALGSSADPSEVVTLLDDDEDEDESGTDEDDPVETDAVEPQPEPAEESYLDLEVGVDEVAADDPWCTVADKLDSNYRAVSAVDQSNPQQLEAVFRQTYDSIAVAAASAPPEIAAQIEVERWVWDRVVTLHDDAAWNIRDVPVEQVVELSEQNLGAFQAVEDYTTQVCS